MSNQAHAVSQPVSSSRAHFRSCGALDPDSAPPIVRIVTHAGVSIETRSSESVPICMELLTQNRSSVELYLPQCTVCQHNYQLSLLNTPRACASKYIPFLETQSSRKVCNEALVPKPNPTDLMGVFIGTELNSKRPNFSHKFTVELSESSTFRVNERSHLKMLPSTESPV